MKEGINPPPRLGVQMPDGTTMTMTIAGGEQLEMGAYAPTLVLSLRVHPAEARG